PGVVVGTMQVEQQPVSAAETMLPPAEILPRDAADHREEGVVAANLLNEHCSQFLVACPHACCQVGAPVQGVCEVGDVTPNGYHRSQQIEQLHRGRADI